MGSPPDHARMPLDRPQTAERAIAWASVREVLNIYQAAWCGCDIVTVAHDILSKAIKLGGTDVTTLSLDTVRMFVHDAAAAGFTL